MFYRVFSTPTCFPLPVDLVGAFTSIGTAITTNVVSTLLVGDYLYSVTNNELRKVISVESETTFTLDEAYAADVTDEQITIADKTITYTKASISNYNNTDAEFNGETFFKRSVIDISKDIYFTIDGLGAELSILAE
jgi:hypothetical protein